MNELFNTLNESVDFLTLQETYETLTEKSVVRMDKATLKRRLLTQATLLAAKEAGAKEYKMYVKAAKAKKHWRGIIQQKFGAKGNQKMREFIKAHNALKQG